MVVAALVKIGAERMLRVKDWVGAVPTLLFALNVSEYVPLTTDEVPAKVPVPFPLSTKVTPDGNDAVSVNAGRGDPLAVTENVKALPVFAVYEAALVKAGVTCTAV